MEQLKTPWAHSNDYIAKYLETDVKQGLLKSEAEQRLVQWGLNVLVEKTRPSWASRITRQFASPVVITLLIAILITAVLQEYTDSLAIFIVVMINTLLGYVQESKAEAAIAALKRLSNPRSKVIRDNHLLELDAANICLGDLLQFEAGDYVAADARVSVANQLALDEAILTGESLPASKHSDILAPSLAIADQKNMIFAGTTVVKGSGQAIVIATGGHTQVGHIASLLKHSKVTRTPLQLKLAQVSKQLLWFCLLMVVIVGVLMTVRARPWLEIVMSSISLAVAAIPEGLPAVVTLALAYAVRRLSKRNAIIRHLPAVETLGSTDVICTDKTGTLTTGKMRVRQVVLPEMHDSTADLLSLVHSAILCSNASLINDHEVGDPTELALLYFARDHNVNVRELYQIQPRLAEWSFDSARKRMSVATLHEEQIYIHAKGAPESILPLCDLDQSTLNQIQYHIDSLTNQGFRLLALANRNLGPNKDIDVTHLKAESSENHLTYLGLAAIADPPRPEAVEAIKACKKAGISVVMITGDHPKTAQAIALELGIIEPGQFDGILTGVEIDALPYASLVERVKSVAVYARVSPEHKLNIVRAWQQHGKIVAMTGDGVNDAPALKEAAIGVAMGKSGTEVARLASSMVLADDNFATIVDAVKEGRALHGNIQRTIQYLLSGNLAEILVMLGASIAGWPTPFAPIHLLWINLVTDGLPALALAGEPVPKNILDTNARPSPSTFFARNFKFELIFVALMTTTMALTIYGLSLHYYDELTAKTNIFSFMVFAELFRSFASRSDRYTFFQLGVGSNIFHLVAVALPILFQLGLHHTKVFQNIFQVRPISIIECVLMISLTLIPVSMLELRKLMRKKHN